MGIFSSKEEDEAGRTCSQRGCKNPLGRVAICLEDEGGDDNQAATDGTKQYLCKQCYNERWKRYTCYHCDGQFQRGTELRCVERHFFHKRCVFDYYANNKQPRRRDKVLERSLLMMQQQEGLASDPTLGDEEPYATEESAHLGPGDEYELQQELSTRLDFEDKHGIDMLRDEGPKFCDYCTEEVSTGLPVISHGRYYHWKCYDRIWTSWKCAHCQDPFLTAGAVVSFQKRMLHQGCVAAYCDASAAKELAELERSRATASASASLSGSFEMVGEAHPGAIIEQQQEEGASDLKGDQTIPEFTFSTLGADPKESHAPPMRITMHRKNVKAGVKMLEIHAPLDLGVPDQDTMTCEAERLEPHCERYYEEHFSIVQSYGYILSAAAKELNHRAEPLLEEDNPNPPVWSPPSLHSSFAALGTSAPREDIQVGGFSAQSAGGGGHNDDDAVTNASFLMGRSQTRKDDEEELTPSYKLVGGVLRPVKASPVVGGSVPDVIGGSSAPEPLSELEKFSAERRHRKSQRESLKESSLTSSSTSPKKQKTGGGGENSSSSSLLPPTVMVVDPDRFCEDDDDEGDDQDDDHNDDDRHVEKNTTTTVASATATAAAVPSAQLPPLAPADVARPPPPVKDSDAPPPRNADDEEVVET